MQENKLTIDEAIALFIKSLTNLVWILAFGLFAEVFLSLTNSNYKSNVFSAIRSIIVGAFWLIALFKIIDFIDRRWDTFIEINQSK